MKKLLLLFCLIPFIVEAGVTQADLDKFGGYTGLQGTMLYAVSGTAESVTGLSLTETGAFAGKDLEWCTVQPDISKELYFLIKENTDDTIYIQPCDNFYRTSTASALEGNIIANNDMEAAGTWANYNTPSTNDQGTSGVLFDSYYWHVAGDADDGTKQTGLHIMDNRTGHETSWGGAYKAVGHIYVVSGTVKMYAEDNTGELTDTQIGTTDGGTWEDFEVDFSAGEKVTDDTGEIRFYCSGDACEFYLDEVYIGEDDYGNYYLYVDLQEYNDGTEAYQVYGNWRVEKIGMRWWIIDPLDNVFVVKSINNFDGALIQGHSEDGDTLNDAMRVKYADTTPTVNTQRRMQTMIDMGFNCMGSILTGYCTPDDVNWDTYPLIPFHSQVRLVNTMADADSVLDPNVGEMDCYGTSYDNWVDAFDADYSSSLETDMWSADIGWSFSPTPYPQFRQPESTYGKVCPYYAAQYAYPANIWMMGVDLDEEPPGSASGWGHLGYVISCTDITDTDADDAINDTLIAFVNQLRSWYTPGGEAIFVSNTDYDGSNEISPTYDWSGISGYDSTDTDTDGTPDNDEAAIALLNAAWGTTYPTENGPTYSGNTNAWNALYEENGKDDDGTGYGLEAQSGWDLVADTGDNRLDDADAELKVDMDNLHGNYSRKYLEGFHDVVFKTAAPLKGTKLNLGMGFGYHNGWPKGMKSADESITYTPVYYKDNIGGGGSAYSSPAMIFPPDWPYDRDRDETWPDWYDINELPFIIESWQISSGDTAAGHSGTIDNVYLTTDTDYAIYIGALENSTGKIVDGTEITWNSGSDTGTLFYSFDTSVDCPLIIEHDLRTDESYSSAYYTSVYIIIADSGSIGNLDTSDTITDGSESFEIASGTYQSASYPIRVSMIVDNEANFNCDYNSPETYAMTYVWFCLIDDDDPTPVRYYRLVEIFTSETGLICYQDGQNPGGWNAFPGDFTDVNVGDSYHTQYMSPGTGTWQDEFYLLKTEERKARMYENILKQCFDFQMNNGDYAFLGHAYFGPWDYGFSEYKSREIKGWGLMSVKDNLYDGVEATTLGADGTAGTWDDEERDYGDVVTRISAYQNNIYRDLMPKSQSSGCSASGVSFR